MVFKEGPGNITDSLILSIDFQDGDGDIGLSAVDAFPPYHDFDFVIDEDRFYVTFSGEFKTPFKRIEPVPAGNGNFQLTTTSYSNTDGRPSNFDCQFYVIDSFSLGTGLPIFPFENLPDELVYRDTLRDDDGNIIRDSNGSPRLFTPVDTFFVAKNENNKNIIVDFFRKRAGEYEFIDWTRVFDPNGCGLDFNARFPEFAPDRDGKSLEGTIRYGMASEGFRLVLRTDTFKIQVRIKDRNFNTSNMVESPDLTLQSIGGGG